MKTSRIVAAALTTVLLSGCSTGPDYATPDLSLPGKWSEPLDGGEKAASGDLTRWWSNFGDSALDSLIARAVDANLDLKAAEARVREARASERIAGADFWPQVNASGSYQRIQSKDFTAAGATRGQNSVTLSSNGVSVTGSPAAASGPTFTVTPNVAGSGNTAISLTARPDGASGPSFTLAPDLAGNPTLTASAGRGTPKRQSDLFRAGFDASWELDVFGATRRALEAAKADTDAAEESRRDVLVSLVAEVARNYFELRSAQDLLDIANGNISIQEKTLEVVRARFQAGLTSELDVKTAEAQLATTRSSVPALETQIKLLIHRLGVLLGREPGALHEELQARSPHPLPAAPPEIPVGLPSDLLRRRPDVRRAERALAAATARIGVAKADLFPRFSLTGSFAADGATFDGLNLGANQFWSVGPGVRWPVFDAGRIRANVRVQNARQEQALATYEQAVITSFEDVENALVAFAKEQTRLASLSEAVDANRRALDIADELYARGLVNFLNVLDAQRSLFAAEQQRTQSRTTILTDLVALYKALGGGWDDNNAPATPSPAQTKVS